MTDLDAARTFVHSHARLIDRRRFQHLFDDAPADLVLAALAAYRNPDGGIGALEPDLRTPASQPIPVRYAFDILAELPASEATHELAVSALDWLQTITLADGGVPFVLPSASEQAAAPWLPPAPESSLTATAQLAAAGLRLAPEHPWPAGVSDYCWQRVADVTPEDAYTFLFVVDFLDASLERDRADRALEALARTMPADGRIVVGVGEQGEVLEPLTLVPRPDHAGGRLLDPALLDRALDALDAGQADDGGWDFTWAKWNPAAAWEWRGAVTVNALQTLRAYGRL